MKMGLNMHLDMAQDNSLSRSKLFFVISTIPFFFFFLSFSPQVTLSLLDDFP